MIREVLHVVPEAEGPCGYFFLFLRWTRVRRSSLRCFFLAIRLRRFLMTEPTSKPFVAESVRLSLYRPGTRIRVEVEEERPSSSA